VEEKKANGESEPFEVFEAIFETRVRTTMHVLALLGPWDVPLYIGRIWCIFEFWKAMHTEGCVLEVVLPEEEELRLKDALRSDGMKAMWKAFETLRIQDAQASIEADRANILRLVDPEAESPEDLDNSIPCAALNREVMQRLQAWCVDTAAVHAESQIISGNMLSQSGLFAGSLLMAAADFERADTILRSVRDSMEAVGAEDSPGYLSLLRHEAQLLNHQGRHEEANDVISRVLEGLQGHAMVNKAERFQVVLARRFEFPKVLCVGGETANLRGQVASAVEFFQRARSAYEVAGASGDHGHAHLLTELASCLCRQGRHEEAEEALAECSGILADVSCLTPLNGELLKVFGRCRLCQGRYMEATELFVEARRIFEDTGAARSSSFGVLLQLMGSCQLQQLQQQEGSALEAQALFDEASALFESIGATGRPEYQMLPVFYGFVHFREGRHAEAAQLFDEARTVFDAAGMGQTPECGRLLLAMGRCKLQQGYNAEAVELFNEAKAAYEAAGADAAFAHMMLLGS
jgi:tetratricopeptide (TPR) repeat protein